MFPVKVEQSWTAPIVFRDEDSCERFRLAEPVDDLMRQSFCAPMALLPGASYRGLDREHLAVSPTGIWFYQQ
ncbi:hypothetical protein [Candidatus Binatus sp.]|uniref:hypothetical protein n=1 Tax=Candidatus Binatus sp. TaxID=2811406 RepID=UPI003C3B6782